MVFARMRRGLVAREYRLMFVNVVVEMVLFDVSEDGGVEEFGNVGIVCLEEAADGG